MALPRQADDHVWAQFPVVAGKGLFGQEIDMGRHARQLHDIVARLMLTPAAAGFRRGLQGIDELAGLRARIGLHQGQRLHLLGQPAIGRGACLFDLAQAFSVFLEVAVDRREQRGDLLLPLFEVAGGAFVVLVEDFVGKAEKRFLVVFERFGGERLHLRLDLAAQRSQRRDFAQVTAFLCRKRRPRVGQRQPLGLELGRKRALHGLGADRAFALGPQLAAAQPHHAAAAPIANPASNNSRATIASIVHSPDHDRW